MGGVAEKFQIRNIATGQMRALDIPSVGFLSMFAIERAAGGWLTSLPGHFTIGGKPGLFVSVEDAGPALRQITADAGPVTLRTVKVDLSALPEVRILADVTLPASGVIIPNCHTGEHVTVALPHSGMLQLFAIARRNEWLREWPGEFTPYYRNPALFATEQAASAAITAMPRSVSKHPCKVQPVIADFSDEFAPLVFVDGTKQ